MTPLVCSHIAMSWLLDGDGLTPVLRFFLSQIALCPLAKTRGPHSPTDRRKGREETEEGRKTELSGAEVR